MDKKREFFLISIFAVILVFGVTGMVGTLTSGFHLVDDHEFLKWSYLWKYEDLTLFDIIRNVLSMDFSIRYRPLYKIFRVISVYIFDLNMFAYFALKASEIVAAVILLYYCGRKMGANQIYSLLFSCLSMVGYQSCTWWKLGTHEAQGMVLLAAGWLSMLCWLKTERRLWAIISVILFFLMCNYKESFIMLMPFLMLYVLYDELKEIDKPVTFLHIRNSIRKRFGYFLTLGIISIIPVLIIIFVVGSNNYGSVGLSSALSLSAYREGLVNSIHNDLKWYYRFGILLLLILLTYWDALKKLWPEVFLVLSFLLPQFVLYGRAGILERYVLPSSVGFALFFVIIIPKQSFLAGKRRVAYVLGIFLLLAVHGRVMLREADYFRYRGESVTTMLETISKLGDQDKKVLSCLSPYTESNLTIDYWMKLKGKDYTYYWLEEEQLIYKEVDDYPYHKINLEEDSMPSNFEDMDIIVMYNKEDRHWTHTPSLDVSSFTELLCGTLTIYVRNGRGIELPDVQVEGFRMNI